MTKVTTKTVQFPIDYQHEPLSDLFVQQPTDCDFSDALSVLDVASLTALIKKARLTLIIACDALKNSLLIKALQDAADTGVRIYILLGDDNKNRAAIDMLSGRCLVRTGVSQQGVMILVDHATSKAQGFLLMTNDALIENAECSRYIPLETSQLQDCYRSFCKLFWENAVYEYLQQNQQLKCVTNPDGSVVTNHSHQLFGTLSLCLEDTLAQLSGASRSELNSAKRPPKLLLEAVADNINARAGEGVALTDSYIPSLLFSEEGSWLLPDQTDLAVANWCLKLSSSQDKRLFAAYQQAMSDAAWQYSAGVTIGDMAHQQHVRFTKQPQIICKVEQLRQVELDDIHTTTIDDFFGKTAQDLAMDVIGLQPELLAHRIDYTVKIHPPYCPAEAIKDSLYQNWADAEQRWQARLSTLASLQQRIDQQQGNISDALKGFVKGFLLGQGQSGKQLKQEIETLKAWSVTAATPAEREHYRERLDALQNRINQRSMDTALELDKAGQNRLWEEQKKILEKSLADKAEIAKQKSVGLEQLTARRLTDIEVAEQRFTESWNKAVTNLSEQQVNSLTIQGMDVSQYSPSEDNADTSENEEMAQAARIKFNLAKRQALAEMDVKQAQAWKSSVKEKLWKKQYFNFNQALVNRQQLLNKIDRDIQEAQKAYDISFSAQSHAIKALQDHGSAFTYQPEATSDAFDKQLGLKNNSSVDSKFNWPEEELPQKGTTLCRHKQKRYLVIFSNDQLAQAYKDAEHLSAKIVCNKEAFNA